MKRGAIISADSLNAVDLFRGLAFAERAAIAARLQVRQFEAGEQVVTSSYDTFGDADILVLK